jgi:hypothetical protein
MLALLAALLLQPDEWLAAGSVLVPPLADPRARVAATQLWPAAWWPTAALTLLTGLLLGRGGRWAALAAPLAALDLVLVNGSLNPLANEAFYDLRPDVHGLVAGAGVDDGLGGPRWFSYGILNTPGLVFEPTMQRAASDVWLYYLDRQSLLPRTPALDGLPGAFDVDRTGWAPRGATLAVTETVPERFSEVHPRLRLAGVRWILSFRPLPPALVREHASVKLPEVTEPLGLFELRGALPRAYFAASLDAAERMPLDGSNVRYEYVDAHTVRAHARTPPGFVIVLDGYHPDWSAEDESGRTVPVLRANGRYRAIPTTGGSHVFTLRYRPAWRGPALAGLAAGLVAAIALAVAGGVSEFTATRGTRRANLRAGARL